MAGTIIADFIRADANKFSINVGNTIIASVNSLGILSNTGNVMISSAGAITANNISTGRIVTPSVMPANSILQVVQTVKTSIFSVSSASWTAVTGYSATITPTSSTSKILVMFSHCQTTDYHGGTGWYSSMAALYRGATQIGYGDLRGSEVQSSVLQYNSWKVGTPVSFQYLDSPATTSPTTYQVYVRNGTGAGSYNVYVGGSAVSTNNDYASVPSIITLMEIAQ